MLPLQLSKIWNAMKKMISFSVSILFCLVFSAQAHASLEIFCAKDKEISYDTYLAGKYYDKPVVWGAHTLYGPWIKTNLNCGSGYVEVKWEIVDHYARSYYCTQTIWVSGGYSNPVSVWCPKEATLYCDEVDNYKFPKPEVSGYGYTISGPWVSKKINDCGVGSIWVEWKVTDGCGRTTYCKVAYWVKERYSKISIWWPKDFDADACKDQTDPKYLPYPYGYPEINTYNKCGKYGINFKDEIYTFPNDPGICRKIVRTWTIIDWCTYNPNAYGYHQEGIWKHTQLIKVISKSKPGIYCKGEVIGNSETYAKTAWIDIPVPTVTNSCNGNAVVSHNSPYATKPYSADASGNYPIGVTNVVFTVTDACGNYSQCTTRVNVLDKTAPQPYCIASLVAGIGWHSDGVYTIIDPKKFDIGSYDNCTPKEKLKFTAEPFRYNCDSLGTRNLKIWVEDEAGNKNFCRVKLILQDNTGMCPKKVIPPVPTKDTLVVAGLIFNLNNQTIDSVTVNIIDSSAIIDQMANGKFKFTTLLKGTDYKLTPFKSYKFLDGITTDDYTLLVNYVQGLDTFTHKAQYLAADIDGNDTINLDDVLLLGYYLVAKTEKIPSSQASWRFIPKSYNLSSLQILNYKLPLIPNSLLFSPLDSNCLDADFVGIKIGDVNLSLLDTSHSVSTLSNNTLELRERAVIPEFVRVKAYPNPAKERTYIDLYSSLNNAPAQIDIFDLSGRKLYSQKSFQLSGGFTQVSVSKDELNGNGVYFYRIKISNNLISGKLIFQ